MVPAISYENAYADEGTSLKFVIDDSKSYKPGDNIDLTLKTLVETNYFLLEGWYLLDSNNNYCSSYISFNDDLLSINSDDCYFEFTNTANDAHIYICDVYYDSDTTLEANTEILSISFALSSNIPEDTYTLVVLDFDDSNIAYSCSFTVENSSTKQVNLSFRDSSDNVFNIDTYNSTVKSGQEIEVPQCPIDEYTDSNGVKQYFVGWEYDGNVVSAGDRVIVNLPNSQDEDGSYTAIFSAVYKPGAEIEATVDLFYSCYFYGYVGSNTYKWKQLTGHVGDVIKLDEIDGIDNGIFECNKSNYKINYWLLEGDDLKKVIQTDAEYVIPNGGAKLIAVCSMAEPIHYKSNLYSSEYSLDNDVVFPGDTVTLSLNSNNNKYFVSSVNVSREYTLSRTDTEAVTESLSVSQNADGSYTFTVPNDYYYGIITITANFEKESSYTRSISFDSYFTTVTHDGSTINPWETVELSDSGSNSYTFSVNPDDGYSITAVTASGADLVENENGTYTLANITGNVGVNVSVKQDSFDADYVLYTAEDLFAFAEDVNNGNSYKGKVVRLGNDIDLGNKEWTPIGYKYATGSENVNDALFEGTFDGAGYTISGLNIQPVFGDLSEIDSSTYYAQLAAKKASIYRGFFGYVKGATIQNLTIEGQVVSKQIKVITESASGNTTESYKYDVVAGLVGFSQDTNILNCTNKASITTQGVSYAAGIVAQNSYSVRIYSNDEYVFDGYGIYGCKNYGSIIVGDDSNNSGPVAGIGPCASTGLRTSHCVNYGSITSSGSNNIYGISYQPGETFIRDDGSGAINRDEISYIDRCANYGDITNNYDSSTAGVSSSIYGITRAQAHVTNCVNYGNLVATGSTSSNNAIGIAQTTTRSSIQNCVNYGSTSVANGSAHTGDPLYMPTSQTGSARNNYGSNSNVTAAQAGGAYVDTENGKVALSCISSNEATFATSTISSTTGNPTIAFKVSEGATVTVDGQVVGNDGISLSPGTYTANVVCEGYFPVSRTFTVVEGQNNTVIVPMTLACEVTFNVLPSIASVVVMDSTGTEMQAVEGNPYKFKLVSGQSYTYTASGNGCSTESDSFVAVDGATVNVELVSEPAVVTFSVLPVEAQATITVKQGTKTFSAMGGSDGKSFLLKVDGTYSYSVSADNFTTVTGTVTPTGKQDVEVTMERKVVSTTISATSADATIVVKDSDGQVVEPEAEGGFVFNLQSGLEYTYEVSAPGYLSKTGSFTAGPETVSVDLETKSVEMTLNVAPAEAQNVSVAIQDADGNSLTVQQADDGTYTFVANKDVTYMYTVTADGYVSASSSFIASDAALSVTLRAIASSSGSGSDESGEGVTSSSISAGSTITAGGTYYLTKGTTGEIKVSTTSPVTIVGTGTSVSDCFYDLTIRYTVQNADLTIKDLYIKNNVGLGTSQGDPVNDGYNIIDFTGVGNKLNFAETNLLENQEYVKAAGIHVGPGVQLTIGDKSEGSTLYIYKYSQGAGIGGDTDEACGSIIFAGGNIFVKGSKTGAVIGGDDMSGNTTNGDILITGGNLNIINKAGGAAIGTSKKGACAGNVTITGGTTTIITDWKASAIGYGTDACGSSGTLTVTGGSLKTVTTLNCRTGNGNSGLGGQKVDVSMVTANKGNLELLVFDTGGTDREVTVEGTSYSATSSHKYYYSESTSSTMMNWSGITDTCVYLYLDKTKEYTLECQGKTYSVKWGEYNGSEMFLIDNGSGSYTPGGITEDENTVDEVQGATVDVVATTEVSGTVATTTVSADAVSNSIDAAVAEGSSLNIGVQEGVDVSGATEFVANVDADVFATIAKAGVDVVVSNPAASVELPAKAVSDLASKGQDVTVSVSVDAAQDTTTIDIAAAGQSVSKVSGGVKVSVPVSEGSVLAGQVIVLVDADGTETVVTKSVSDSEGVISLLDGSATIKVENRSVLFPDVTSADWFADKGIVEFVSSRGLMTGVDTAQGTQEFQGNANLTRAMFATVLHRLELKASTASTDVGAMFVDVANNQWYSDGILWAAEQGIVKGYTDENDNPTGIFGANDDITREQLALMMYRYAKTLGLDTSARDDLSAFTDANAASYGLEALQWAVAVGLLEGDSGAPTLRPTGYTTRAEAAVVVQRMVNLIVNGSVN